MLEIDGSRGEGGGQILRSSLALSMILGKPFSITKIRARRKKPGLMRQHLTSVRAAAQICDADVRGAEIGSSNIVFAPGNPARGDYHFCVGTAGSTTLVLQTLLPGLLAAEGQSSVVLEGGTHNPFAPPLDFLAKAFLPMLRRMGARIDLEVDRFGFYPQGGGRLTATIHDLKHWQSFELFERGAIKEQQVKAMVANLPRTIAQRECRTIARETQWPDRCFCEEELTCARGPGNVVFIELACEHVTELFTAFGMRGVPAEEVAKRVLNEARQYIASDVPVGPYLADQLMLPLGIAAEFGRSGAFRTMKLSQHSQTNREVLGAFLEHASIEVVPDKKENCTVRFTWRERH
jgi:RNA 3'-terminal phosphate cyclase (ATP)